MLGTQLRKLLGEEEWEDSLQVRKDKEHFIFTVQSTGSPCRISNVRLRAHLLVLISQRRMADMTMLM